MDRPLRAIILAVALGIWSGSGRAQEAIEPLGGRGTQQEIEVLQPAQQQQVQAVDGTAVQEIGKAEVPTQTQRTMSKVGKVMVGILAAAVAIGASAASLLLL
jgi:hypothetical protein